MSIFLKHTALGFLAFAILDGLWLGVIMKEFYRDQLAPIARMSDGGIAPVWSVAVLVYVLLGAGVAVFVVPRAVSLASAAFLGAALGLVIYGVYDLTNYSTLARWPAAVTIADILWGVVATSLASMAIFAVSTR